MYPDAPADEAALPGLCAGFGHIAGGNTTAFASG